MASPGIGRCVATVPAAAPGPAPLTEVRCGDSPPPAAKPPDPPPASPPVAAYLLAAGMAVIVITLAVALYRARRR
jgi:hypothetical protein